MTVAMMRLAERVDSLTADVRTFADAVSRLDAAVRALARGVANVRGPVERFERACDDWQGTTGRLIARSDRQLVGCDLAEESADRCRC
jgi:hypothetical protein